MTHEIKDFILKEKMSDRLKSGIDLSRMIEDKIKKRVIKNVVPPVLDSSLVQ